MTAKTNTERDQAAGKRRDALGLSEVRGIWAPAALHPAIRAQAVRLTRKPIKSS